MRRKVILITATAVLAGLSGLMQRLLAEQDPGAEPHTRSQVLSHSGQAERELERMSANLNLTEGQKARIRPILQERNQQLKDLRAKAFLPQGVARAKASEIRKAARRQINEILTPEQREQQKAMRQGFRQRSTG